MQIVDSRFELLSHVATGGMGHVYRAHDRNTGEIVAVKILHSQNDEQRKQFLREAHILADLQHPGIVRHIAHGQTESCAPYLAMEWLEGENLGIRLRRGPLPFAEALRLAARVASALAVAHRRGIVHRDVKPQNIFLTNHSSNEARLVDFGVAHLTSDAAEQKEDESLVGTPAYMAPEQIRNAPLDQRIDIFSLGCVLFECLTGSPPWQSQSNVAILAKILFEEPPPLRALLPTLPAPIASLVERMLEKDRARRPADALALAAELESLSALDATESKTEASVPPPSLTMAENSLVCVVLASGEGKASLAAIEKTYGARVETFIDGTIAAVLQGALEATDLATRAARCSLALRDSLGKCKIALSTGRAVVTDALPMGEAIEAAAKLFSNEVDEQGRVRIDEPTKSLIELRFEVGHDSRSHLLCKERLDQGEARQLLGQKTPCVGREAELLALQSSFLRCLQTPEATPVLLTGVAGSGKSRLWHELEVKIRQTSAEIWLTRGDPIRQGSRLAMLGQAIRQAASIHEGDSTEAAQAKLQARVRRDAEGKDVERIAAFLGEICGVHFPDEHHLQLKAARSDAMLMADQMRRAFEDFLLEATRARPIALVLEDLQWSDLPTVQFIDAALRNAANRPFFVFALARPEIDQVFQGLWADRHACRIALGDLSLDASKALVYAVLGQDTTKDKATRIATLAAGNPFALEELIRAVAEGQSAELPQSVLAVAQARLGALPEEQRLVLRAASIVGDPFGPSALRALLGSKGENLEARLAELTRSEVIWPHDDLSTGLQRERHYLFRHSLLREAAYAMLTDEDRALGHRLAAEWLSTAGEQDAGALAQHYDRGGDKARAAKEYARAAEQALEASDLAAVLSQTKRATECGARGEDLASLKLLAAIAYHWRAEYEQCERAALDALQGSRPISVGWYRAAAELAEALLPLGKMTPLSALGKALRAPPGKGAAARAFVLAAATLSMQLSLAGQRELGHSLMQSMEEVQARLGDAGPVVRARAHFAHATEAYIAGDWGLALMHAKLTVKSYEEAGDLRNATLMLSNMGHLNMELGGYEAAVSMLRAAAEQADRIGLASVSISTRQTLGLALAHSGALDVLEEARRLGEAAIRMSEAARDTLKAGRSHIYYSYILLKSGDIEQGIAEARLASTQLQAMPNRQAFALAMLAHALLHAGKVAEAHEPAHESYRLLQSLGGLDEGETFARLTFARVMLAEGRTKEAQSALQAAKEAVLARASKITDPHYAKSFLERVPENAATLALVRKLEAESAS